MFFHTQEVPFGVARRRRLGVIGTAVRTADNTNGEK